MRYTFIFALLLLTSTQALALTVNVSAKMEGVDKPTITGKTNLPHGTELVVTLRKGTDYTAQIKTHVDGGAFHAGPFSQKGAALAPGTYTLEVTMPPAYRQPDPVLEVIGDKGNKLQGPLVKKAKYGGKIIEYRNSFKIGNIKTAPQKAKSAGPKTK